SGNNSDKVAVAVQLSLWLTVPRSVSHPMIAKIQAVLNLGSCEKSQSLHSISIVRG
ncbi:hypothetical protein J6590_042524, partial [Homalodisca vitripennis]